MEYIRDGILKFLFDGGKSAFAEIITNYSKPELRPYEMVKENGEKPENDKQFTSKGLTLSINLTQNFEMSNRNGMMTLPVSSTMLNPVELNKYILKDNLVTVSYTDMVFMYNAELDIRHNDAIHVHNMLNRLFSRIHLGKKFFLGEEIRLKHSIYPYLIKVIQNLYNIDNLSDLNDRLNEMTFGNIYEELDRTTGNKVTFVDIFTRPIVTVSGISTTEEGGNLSLELEVALPSKFWLSSVYSEEYLIDLPKIVVDFNDISDLNDIDRENILNFDIETIQKYSHLLDIEPSDLEKIIDGTLVPFVNLTTVSDEDRSLVGLNQPGFQRIERINLSINEAVNESFINEAISSNVNIDDFTKIKTIIESLFNVNESLFELPILDELTRSSLVNDPVNHKLVVTKNQRKLVEDVDYTIDNGSATRELTIKFIKDIKGSIITLELYKRKKK